jgi:hypothetical protein
MNKTILIILFVFSIISNTQAGGGRSNNYIEIDVFEQTFNFYYKAVDDTVRYLNNKGKEKLVKATVNVALYNINKDSTSYLFDHSFNEKIVSFFYETSYVDSSKTIDFVHCDNYYGNKNIKNNRNIKERKVYERIFIITYSFKTNKYTLWSCHKTGRDLKKMSEFNKMDNIKIDVFNKNILTLTEGARTVTIDKKSY